MSRAVQGRAGQHAQVLRDSRLFAMLNEEEEDILVASSQWRWYARGELIAGCPVEEASRLLYIACGSAVVYCLAGGNRVTLRECAAGQVFQPVDITSLGGAIFVDATAQETLVARMPLPAVVRAVNSNSDVARSLIQLLLEELATFQLRISEALLCDVPTRVAHTLVRLALKHPHHVVCETHEELASWAGTSRQQVTERLGRFRIMGWIEYSRGQPVRVLDMDALGAEKVDLSMTFQRCP